MGNIVMMEALKLQVASGSNALNNYVLMEAAVPAHCYDTNAPFSPGLYAAETPPQTPNTYLGYPGAINAAIRGSMVNFFNTNDFALAGWVFNELAKPQTSYYIGPSLQPYLVPSTLLTDPREIMAFCARPRSLAVGAQSALNKVTSKHVDFVICDRLTLKVLAAIELDDKSHAQFERGFRDSFLVGALSSAGIPLIRFPARQSYSPVEVREKIASAVSPPRT